MGTLTEILKNNRVFSCLECGKCTAACPISQFNDSYSPRRLLAEGLFYGTGDLASDKLLWSCLTCLLCAQRCPVDVKYADYMRDVRAEAYALGKSGNPSHGGALQSIMEIAASPKLKQNRTGWIENSIRTKPRGDVLYFVGCLPYYQDFFAKDYSFLPISIARDTARILNHIGIEPVVMNSERCCGHDLYWLGQLEQFDQIGQLNLKEIEESGAKTIITSCPECAYTLKTLYEERLRSHLQVKHISEVLADNIGKLKFKALETEITYHDPCRLGRYLGIYEQPRKILSSIPGVRLLEMPHNRRGAICCGTTNWMNCDATSKKIQFSRMTEALKTGAKTLVTSCPKCQIHFRCSECGAKTEKVGLELTDFVNIVTSALES
jgi:Fe-S oxidoreductase